MFRLIALVLVAILGATANKSGLLWESASGNVSNTSGNCNDMNPGGPNGGGRFDEIKGCPDKIPILLNGKVLAGVIWDGKGNEISQLACNGKCFYWYAETMYTTNYYKNCGSMIINPGCTLYVFEDYNYHGTSGEYTAGHYTKVSRVGKGFYKACKEIACFSSLIWTCKQTYPTCTPKDKWETITELDNTESSVSTDFTYEKKVGTTFSQSMTDSMSVSTEVSAAISIAFWKITTKLGFSHTTKYDWAHTDTETKSKSHTYTVTVKVPPKTKVSIKHAVGTCGGSKIYTQMFKVKDTGNSRTGENILVKYNGKMTSYVLPGKHVEDHTGHDTSACLNGNGADYSGTTSKTISGRTCQKWSSQSPNKHGFGALGNHNYCRNPNNRDGVWCYTQDRRKKWEFCYVPICG